MANYPQSVKSLLVSKAMTQLARMSLSILVVMSGSVVAPGPLTWVEPAQAQDASSPPQTGRMRWQPKAEQGQAQGTLSGGRRGSKTDGNAPARWKPKPEQGRMAGTLSGGRRGAAYDACSNDSGSTRLNLLVPSGQTSLLSQHVQPTLMWQVSTPEATEVEFILSDVTQPDPLYVSTQVAEKDGLMQVTLPEAVSLKEGQLYRWAVTLQCPEGDAVEIYARSFIRLVDGEPLVHHPESSSSVVSSSQAALELAINAAEDGIWYDALAYAYRAHMSDPSNGEAASAFATLLESAQ